MLPLTVELDADRRLALAYIPASARPAVEALWRLDASLAAILATGTEPAISQLRLAWWREALERLDGAPPPAEPVLQGLAAHVLPTGIGGGELAAMEEGWLILLSDEALTDEESGRYAALRGGLLFAWTARLLGDPDFPVARAGELWALADLARHSQRANEVMRPPTEPKMKWPRRLRPLGMLAMLARRDFDCVGKGMDRQGSPARMLGMMWHWLSGN